MSQNNFKVPNDCEFIEAEKCHLHMFTRQEFSMRWD